MKLRRARDLYDIFIFLKHLGSHIVLVNLHKKHVIVTFGFSWLIKILISYLIEEKYCSLGLSIAFFFRLRELSISYIRYFIKNISYLTIDFLLTLYYVANLEVIVLVLKYNFFCWILSFRIVFGLLPTPKFFLLF